MRLAMPAIKMAGGFALGLVVLLGIGLAVAGVL
jgi:hypothetical protein